MPDVLDAMLDAAEGTPFVVNDDGLWCPVCGWLAAPPWWFRDDEDGLIQSTTAIPDHCRECGLEEPDQ